MTAPAAVYCIAWLDRYTAEARDDYYLDRAMADRRLETIKPEARDWLYMRYTLRDLAPADLALYCLNGRRFYDECLILAEGVGERVTYDHETRPRYNPPPPPARDSDTSANVTNFGPI